MEDERTRKPVEPEIGVLVVADHERRKAQPPRHEHGWPGHGDQRVRPLPRPNDLAERAATASDANRLLPPAGPETLANRAEVNALLTQEVEGDPEVTSGDQDLGAGALERTRQRGEVLGLRWILDVDP